MSQGDSTKAATLSRRDFLKLMGAAGTALTFAPFVPWGKFMPNPDSAKLDKVPVILPDGGQANVNTFPTNHAEVITYPSTGDRVLDEEAFRKWQFIRLPEELGGAKMMPAHLGHLAWYVYIYGVFGSIGHKKAVKEVNVHVMEACTTQ